MNQVFTFLLSQSIIIPIVAGLLWIKKLKSAWFFFFILLVLAFISEIVSFIFIHFIKEGNAPVIKIYSILECWIILYLFYQWKKAEEKRLIVFLAAICTLIWIVENLVFMNIINFSPYFRVFYAFVIVLLSINQVNSIIVRKDGSLLRNPRFILCLGFIIFFIYQIIYEASFYIGSSKSIIANRIIIGFGYINFAINILYMITILLIGTQDSFRQEPHYKIK